MLKLIFSPSTGQADRLYRALGEHNSLGEKSLYYNLGYWKNSPRDLDEAGEEMAGLLGQTAQLTAKDQVLDVGFGLADQDLYWSRAYGVKSIHGINLCASQLQTATERVAQAGLSDHIHLTLGDATQLTFEDQSFSVVLGLESAFHFSPRTKFFKEALRVLKPGGRLVLADLCTPENARGFKFKMYSLIGRGFWQVPRANLVSPSEYAQQLTDAGFEDVRVESIWTDVHPPFVKFARERLQDSRVAARMNPLFRSLLKSSFKGNQKTKAEIMDYVLVSARKAK